MRSGLYSNNTGGKMNGRNTPRDGSGNAEMEAQLHRENEAMLGALSSSVSQMKTVAGHLGREAEEQNEFLKGLRDAFTTARGGVGSSISGIQNVMGRYGCKHTAMFGIAAFVCLYIIYYVIRG